MLRSAFRAAPNPQRVVAAQRQAIWSGVWRRQFASETKPKTIWSGAWSKRSGTVHNAGHRPTIYNWSWMTNRLDAIFQNSRRSFRFSARRRTAQGTTDTAEPQGLTARMRKLSREYGWTTLGVYAGLTILDFPFCFLLVKIVGTDKIGEIEHWVVSNIQKIIPESVQEFWREYRAALKNAGKEQLGDNGELGEAVEMAGWGVEEAEKANQVEASLGTQLALAYAIHKSFIFLRVPLTAAITPKVVKVLRSWGWNIGKRKSKKPI